MSNAGASGRASCFRARFLSIFDVEGAQMKILHPEGSWPRSFTRPGWPCGPCPDGLGRGRRGRYPVRRHNWYQGMVRRWTAYVSVNSATLNNAITATAA